MSTANRFVLPIVCLLTQACIIGDTSCDDDQGAISCDFGQVPPVCSCEPESDDEAGDLPEGPYHRVYRDDNEEEPVFSPYRGVIAEVGHDASYDHELYDGLAHYVDAFPSQPVQHGSDIVPDAMPTVTCASWTSAYPCFQMGYEVLAADPFPGGVIDRDALPGNWCHTCLGETQELDQQLGAGGDEWLPAIAEEVSLARPCYADDGAVLVSNTPTSVSSYSATWQWLSVHSARWEDDIDDDQDGCGSDHVRPVVDFEYLPMWCLTADQGCNGFCNTDLDCEWMYSLHADGLWPSGEAQCESWPITRKWNHGTLAFDETPHGCFWNTAANGGLIPPMPMPGGYPFGAPICEDLDCEISTIFYEEMMANLGRATVGIDWRWTGSAAVITRVAPYSILGLPIEVGDTLPATDLAYAAWTMSTEGWADIEISRAAGPVTLSLTVVAY